MRVFFPIWTSWFCATLFYFYQYMLRVLPSVGMSYIATDFKVDASQIGFFSGIYYVGYTLMHIPIGILIDRFSVKKILPLCVFFTSIGLIPIVYSKDFIYAILGRLLIGIASSGAVLSLFKIVKLSFGEKNFASMLGVSVTIGLLGAVFGAGPLDRLVVMYKWHTVIQLFIVAGIIFSILSYLVLPRDAATKSEFALGAIWNDLKKILRNKKLLFLSFIAGMMVGPLEGFADAWGPLFFESVYGLSRADATAIPPMLFFGMCFGCCVIGFIADQTKAHMKILIFCGTGMVIAFALIFSKICSINVLYILSFLIGCFSAYQIIVLAIVPSNIEPRLADLTAVACNMIMMIFGAVFHNIIGAVINFYPADIDLVNSKTGSAIVLQALAVIPISLFIAVVLLLVSVYRKSLKL